MNVEVRVRLTRDHARGDKGERNSSEARGKKRGGRQGRKAVFRGRGGKEIEQGRGGE